MTSRRYELGNRRGSLVVAVSAIVVSAASAHAAAPAPPDTVRAGSGGFGDKANSYAWSMAWFKGRLYVGTARSAQCVELATIDFYFPQLGYYRPSPAPGISCPANRYKLDLRAEIWRYAPTTRRWRRMYASPTIPNPRAPGRRVARDIGYRGMVVYGERGRKPALYVGGVTAGEYIPELARANPPRLLRTTNGKDFSPVAGAPAALDTAAGPSRPVGYRAMIVHDGRLFVTATPGLTGDGVIVEVRRPASRSPRFTQVSPPSLKVFELQPFDGALYAGAGDLSDGYSVWRGDAAGRRLAFSPVVTHGAGREAQVASVVSMSVYRRALYVGANGWGGTAVPAAELIRIAPDGGWEVVVGNPRPDETGALKAPISGLPDGFGNAYNAHFWRQQVRGGALYVGTNDWSWTFRTARPLDPLLKRGFGFDLYATCDGRDWWPVTEDAFGDGTYNFGARTLASTPAGGFVGSTNHVEGAAVWRTLDASPCSLRAASSRTSRRGAAARPRRLRGDVARCGTVLSWRRTPRATRYRILRSEYRDRGSVPIARRPALPGGLVPEIPATPAQSGATRVKLSVGGPSEPIGMTRDRAFVDRSARRGRRYAYRVVAVDPDGRASGPSNLAIVPSARPRATVANAACGR